MRPEKIIYSTRCDCSIITEPDKSGFQTVTGQTGRLVLTNRGLRFEGDNKNVDPNFSCDYRDVPDISVSVSIDTMTSQTEELNGYQSALSIKIKGEHYCIGPEQDHGDADFGYRIYWAIWEITNRKTKRKVLAQGKKPNEM